MNHIGLTVLGRTSALLSRISIPIFVAGAVIVVPSCNQCTSKVHGSGAFAMPQPSSRAAASALPISDASTEFEEQPPDPCDIITSRLEFVARNRHNPKPILDGKAVDCRGPVCGLAMSDEYGLWRFNYVVGGSGTSFAFEFPRNAAGKRLACETIGLKVAKTDDRIERCAKITTGRLAHVTVILDGRCTSHRMKLFDDMYRVSDSEAETVEPCDGLYQGHQSADALHCDGVGHQ